jgi:tetratricopeptide (TPR) repeat protein
MLLLVALIAAWSASAQAQKPSAPNQPSAAEEIRARVHGKPEDPKALAKALVDIDALIATSPNDPDAHYVRGWVLSRSGKAEVAVTAYDRAFELDPKFSAALYNAGVVLVNLGRAKEALDYFDRALKIDPKNLDAAYNAGQLHYDQKSFAKAAASWEVAAKLQPEDFQTAKKLVQAYVALGNAAKIKKARDRVFALRKATKDPQLAKLTSYVYDQFDVGKYHIYVYEAFDLSGDLAYAYEFRVTLADSPIGSVNLETSAIIREQGVQFILGMNKGDVHTTMGEYQWKKRPEYKGLRALATKIIADKL